MIRVAITRDELARAGRGDDAVAGPRTEEQYVLARLRNAGVPVLGVSYLVGLERGTLSIRKDNVGGGFVYTWSA